MRVAIILLVAAAVMANSEAVSAMMTSKAAMVGKVAPAVRASDDQGRFLRKREIDESDDVEATEERAGLKDAAKYLKGLFSKNEKAVKLLQRSNSNLLKNNVAPAKLDKAVARLEKAGYSKAQIARFRGADDYGNYFYRNANLDPIRE